MRNEFKPYPWKKVKYVDNDYFENVERLIYNDQDDKLKKQIIGPSRWNEYIAKEMIPETVKWTRLDHPMDSYLLTDQGRLFNTWNARFKIPGFFRFGITYVGDNESVNVEAIFEQMGWKFDHGALIQGFIDNGWKFDDRRRYNKVYQKPPKRRESQWAVGIYKGE